MHRLRIRCAIIAVLLAVTRGGLFVAEDYPLPVDPCIVQVVHTQNKVIMIAAFVACFGSVAVETDHVARNEKRRVRQRMPLAKQAQWPS